MNLPLTMIILAGLLIAVLSWYLAPKPWARSLLKLARRAAGLRTLEQRVGGIRWRYLEAGNGPTLVLLHGFGADGDHWVRVAPALHRRFRIIAPDLPGFGASEAAEGLSFDVRDQADRLKAFLDAIESGPVILAGNSMGGWVASAFAQAYPDRVRALWLLAPLGVENCVKSPILKTIDEGRDSPFDLSSREEFGTRVLAPMFSRKPWLPYPFKAYYGDDAVRRSPLAPRMFSEIRASRHSLEELAREIDVPVLLQWGEDDLAVDVSGAATLEKAFPDIETVIQKNVGHLPMLEAPGASRRLFLDFCRRRIRQTPDRSQGD